VGAIRPHCGRDHAHKWGAAASLQRPTTPCMASTRSHQSLHKKAMCATVCLEENVTKTIQAAASPSSAITDSALEVKQVLGPLPDAGRSRWDSHGRIRPRPSLSRTSHQHEVCFADDVDVDEAQLQTCFGSSQDIFGATETGYLLFYEAVDRGSSGDPPTSGWGSRAAHRLAAAFADEWLIEREESSSADAVGQSRAERRRQTQVDRPARWHKLAVGVLGTATLCRPGVKLKKR